MQQLKATISPLYHHLSGDEGSHEKIVDTWIEACSTHSAQSSQASFHTAPSRRDSAVSLITIRSATSAIQSTTVTPVTGQISGQPVDESPVQASTKSLSANDSPLPRKRRSSTRSQYALYKRHMLRGQPLPKDFFSDSEGSQSSNAFQSLNLKEQSDTTYIEVTVPVTSEGHRRSLRAAWLGLLSRRALVIVA